MTRRSISVISGSTKIIEFKDSGDVTFGTAGEGTINVSGSTHIGPPTNNVDKGMEANGLMRLPVYTVATDATALAALTGSNLSNGDLNGQMFYLSGDGQGTYFNKPNSLYFCRNSIWYSDSSYSEPPPTIWALFTRNTSSPFTPAGASVQTSADGFYARGGMFTDDVVALRVRHNGDADKNYSSFEIWENSSDTWSRTYDVTGSDVTTTAGNGAYFMGGTTNFTSNTSFLNVADYCTSYDAANKIMYVCAHTSDSHTFNARENNGGELNQPWPTLFKTQKSGGSWSALTEIAELSASSEMWVNDLSSRGRITKFMTNDGTIAGRSQPPENTNNKGTNKVSKINFFNPSTCAKTDSVSFSNYDPDGADELVQYWSMWFGTNHDSTKVYSGGTLYGDTFSPSQNYKACYDIIASSSANGWEREAQITGSSNHYEIVSGQYVSMMRGGNSFAFNDDYAVMGMPSYKAATSANGLKHMGAIHIYQKTGATWADHELVQTINGSSSFKAAGLNSNDTHTPYQLYGNDVGINEDNDIVVTVPNYKVPLPLNAEGGAVIVLTKSSGGTTWGEKLHHTGTADAKTTAAPYSVGYSPFRLQHFSTNYMFVSSMSGSLIHYNSVDILKKS